MTITTKVRIPLRRGVIDTTLIKFVSDLRQVGGFLRTLVSSTNKSYRHGMTKILSKVVFVICVCLRIVVSSTYCVVFLVCLSLRLVYPMLLVFLDCPFLITPSVFANVYLVRCVHSFKQWTKEEEKSYGHIEVVIIISVLMEFNALWPWSSIKKHILQPLNATLHGQ